MDEFIEFLDCVAKEAPHEKELNKREYLKTYIREGQALPGKPAWSEERLNKASNEVIDKLYKSAAEPIKPIKQKDVLSRLSGVDNFDGMMKDINNNFLIKNSASEMLGKLTPTTNVNSPTIMENWGSYIYEKFGIYLGKLSYFCVIFNHLDWETFAKISEARQAAQASNDESKNDSPFPENK